MHGEHGKENEGILRILQKPCHNAGLYIKMHGEARRHRGNNRSAVSSGSDYNIFYNKNEKINGIPHKKKEPQRPVTGQQKEERITG